MKKILLMIIVLLLVASVAYCQDQPKERSELISPLTTLTIKSDKEVYAVGEAIYVDYKITNVSVGDITFAPAFDENAVIIPFFFAGSFTIKDERSGLSSEISPLADLDRISALPYCVFCKVLSAFAENHRLARGCHAEGRCAFGANTKRMLRRMHY